MTFGSAQPSFSYTMNGTVVPSADLYKDVGVILTSNLSFSLHINNILSKAYRSLGLVRRAVPSSSNVSLKRSLYLTLVRSQVSYCCQVWRPHLIQDIKALEKLQRRASKYIINNYHMDYKSRLTVIKILPLSLWMELQDVLFFLALLKNPPDNFILSKYVLYTAPTRSAPSGKLRPASPSIPRVNSTRHYYFNRLIRIWNSLPILDIDSPMSSLKRRVYDIYWDHFTSHFITEQHCTWFRVCPCNSCANLPVPHYD